MHRASSELCGRSTVIQNRSETKYFDILVRLDANHEIGLAHAIRVSSVLGLLKLPHSITIVGEGDLIEDFFPGQRFIPIPSTDQDVFISLIEDTQPDLIVVDHPRPGHDFWHRLRLSAGNIPVVAIDDEGGEIEANLVFNGTVLDQYHRYPQLDTQAHCLCGGRFALLRPCFGTTPWENPCESSVLIIVGSANRARDWALQLVSGQIDIRNWGKVRMIVGRAFPDMLQLKHDCDALGVTLEFGLSGENMAKAMSQASVALITGGMIVYEALAVGIPAIVFPQIENLIPEASWFASRGCIVDLGYDGGMDCSLVSENVASLLSSSSERQAMSAVQRLTIDGRGILRAAMEIENLLSNRIPADVLPDIQTQGQRSQP